jgi:hypothetical protein
MATTQAPGDLDGWREANTVDTCEGPAVAGREDPVTSKGEQVMAEKKGCGCKKGGAKKDAGKKAQKPAKK